MLILISFSCEIQLFFIASITLLATFIFMVTVLVILFTCVRASVGIGIQANTLQVTMAALFMFLQRSALFVAPPTKVTLVRFAN